MDSLAARMTPVDLATVLQRAELQDRVDTKYVLYPAVLARLVEQLETEAGGPNGPDGAEGAEGALDVLDIDGRRRFAYESRYFDTADLRTFREHVQGRRRRFKVRTRTYLDSGGSHLELKLAGARGTQKLRWAIDDTDVAQLTGAGHPADSHTGHPAVAAVHTELADRGYPPLTGLREALITTYSRTTLVGRHRPVRLTVDTDLECVGPGRSLHALHDRLLLEVKTPTERDPIHRLLLELGARPVSMSKYGVGVGLTRDLSTRPWAEAISRHLDPMVREHPAAA